MFASALVTVIVAFPAVVPGFTVTVFPFILTIAILSLLELTLNAPVFPLTVNVPLVGYVYVPSVDDNVNLATKNMTQTGVSAQQKIIDGLPLPKEIRKSLKQNNTEESYNSFKVDSFSAYISASLADMIVGAVAFIILYIGLSVLLKILINVLDIVARLPVISTFNAAGGALVGLAESVIIIWIACIVVTAFSSTQWGQTVCKAISDNGILSFIYDNNIIQKFITGIFSI